MNRSSTLVERAKLLSLHIEQAARTGDWFELQQLLGEREEVLKELLSAGELDGAAEEMARIVEIDSRTTAVLASKKRGLAETLGKLAQFQRARQRAAVLKG